MGVKFDYILRKLREDDSYDDTAITAALAQEILDRIAADTTLQTNITNEANTRSGADTALDGRISILENNEIKVVYIAEISSDSGTITKPTNSTIIADEFPGGIDAYVTTIDTGEPSGDNPRTATGDLVDVATFDTSGNYTLTGIPSSYPVMLIYVLKIKAVDYQNLTTDNIMVEEPISERNNIEQYAVTSGTNTYTATPNPALASYITGAQVTLNFGNTNTGASTINLNGLGAKSIITPDGLALTGGELLGIMTLVYDGTSFQILGGSGAGGGAASDLFNYYNFM